MIGPEEAWQRLEPAIPRRRRETLPRRDAAGRVLAEELAATCDLPPADLSAMDGFALGGALPEDPVRPAVTIAAGDPPGHRLGAGEVAAIMTGAPVPLGADRVIPIEQTRSAETAVLFESDVPHGSHIRRRAEIVSRGDLLLPPSTRLGPAALSLAASHGHEELSVFSPPRVSLLVTGDELVSPGETPGAGQIRDSHSDFLLAALTDLGVRIEHLGIAGDDRETLTRKVGAALRADVALVTGGVSMGRFDFVEDSLAELGCETLFDAVAVQPGKPLVAGRHDAGLVFGLPGNPASVMVSFWLFVRPVIRRLLGSTDGYWHGALSGRLTGPLPGAKGRDRFLPAATAFESGELLVQPVSTKGSHDLAAYARGNALVRVPSHREPAAAGDRVEILPLVDWRPGRFAGGAILAG